MSSADPAVFCPIPFEDAFYLGLLWLIGADQKHWQDAPASLNAKEPVIEAMKVVDLQG